MTPSGLTVSVRVAHHAAGWHVDLEMPTPEKHRVTAAKWAQKSIRAKSRKWPVSITARGNVLVTVG